MLYRDYLRPDGEWLANDEGGREESRSRGTFLQQANTVCFSSFPGGCRSPKKNPPTWPMVTQSPPTWGGLGIQPEVEHADCTTCSIIQLDPCDAVKFHQNNIQFSIWYHYTENFMLASAR